MASRDSDWIIPSILAVLGLHVMSAALTSYFGLPRQSAYINSLDKIALVVALAALVAFLWTLWRCYRDGDASPAKTIVAKVGENRAHLAAFVLGLLLLGTMFAAFTRIKEILPLAGGFWADPLLASVDRTLIGTDPWKPMHRLDIGTPLDWIYMTWLFATFAAFWAILATKPSPWKSRSLISYFLLFALGAVAQYLLPSGGPIFYERLNHGTDFAALPVPSVSAAAADWLWYTHHSVVGAVGSGISAWPSMHVAGAVWAALASRGALIRNAAICYALLIWIGSIYLGWHYAIDGLAGAGLAVIAWMLAGKVPARAQSAAARQILSGS